MGDHDEIVAAVQVLYKKLCADPLPEPHKILRTLQKLDRLPITVDVLQQTGIGKVVNKLRKYGGEITDAVKHLVQSWKELVREALAAEEQQEHASPEPEPSPPPSHHTTDEEDEGEEEERQEESEQEEDQSDGDSERAYESDEEGSDDNNSLYEDEASPERESPPPSPPPKRASKHQATSGKHSSDRSGQDKMHMKVEKERAASKRPFEVSPARSLEVSRKESHVYSSPTKKKRAVDVPASESPSKPTVIKKQPMMDDSFANGLFGKPHKLSGPQSSPSGKTQSAQKHKERESEKRTGTTSSKSESSGETHPQKKIMSRHEDERTSSAKQEKYVVNGAVKRPPKSASSREKDSADQASSKYSGGMKHTKTSSSTTTTSSSSPLKKTSQVKSKLSSSQTKPSSAPTSKTISTKGRELDDSEMSSMSKNRDHDKANTAKSSKAGKPSSSVKIVSGANSRGTEPKQRRVSSVDMSGKEDDDFNNTGMSFADCLAGPVKVKVKKPVKRLNTSGGDSKSSASLSSKTALSKSKSTKHSSSSVKSGDSSSKSSSGKGAGSSKSSSGKDKGKDSSRTQKSNDLREKTKLLHPSSSQPKLEDIHREITYSLPEISADYKPLRLPELSPKKRFAGMNEEGSYIGSKHARTKVFSGRVKSSLTAVPSLFDACMRILLDNMDALEEIGVPYDIIKPVLEKATPQQLLKLEDFNPYLIEDTDALWQYHAVRDFRKYKPEEMESWRELYLRKMDEREQRLKNITANITASMAQKDPGRLTKMAFVNGPAKPPRNVKRQQVRHGTGRIESSPPRHPHRPYAPSKHAGDQGPIRSSASSTVPGSSSVGRSERGGGGGAGAGGGGGVGGGGGSQNYGNISMSNSNGGSSRGGRGKTVAPMMQKALRMKKMFRR